MEEDPCFSGKVIHHKILSHYQANCVDKFFWEKIEQRPKKDKENEFKNMWIIRYLQQKMMYLATFKYSTMFRLVELLAVVIEYV